MLLKKNGEEQRKQLLDKANLEGYAVAAKFTGKSDEHQVQKALASNFRYFKLFVFSSFIWILIRPFARINTPFELHINLNQTEGLYQKKKYSFYIDFYWMQ